MKRCSYCGQNYPDDHAFCPVDATPLDILPDPSSPQVGAPSAGQSPGTPLPTAFPAREALVTLAVFVVCLVGQKLTIPTMAKAAAVPPPIKTISILALGVQPLLFGYVLVELAALLVPVWRPLRTGGAAGRGQLHRASLILGMILALGQAFILAAAFEATGSSGYGPGFRIITILILLGATAALVVLARIVEERGLGGGFPILLLAFTVPDIARRLGYAYSAVQHGVLTGSALQTGAFGLALLVGATLWLFSPYCLPGTEPWEHPALVSRPGCGVVPLSLVVGILAFIAPLFRLYSGGSLVLPWHFDIVELVLSIIAAIGLAYLFNRPDRFSAVWNALSPLPPEQLPRIKPVMLECVFFIGVAVWGDACLARVMGYSRFPAAISVMLVTGIIADIVREWRARTGRARLVSIWEIQQVYAVPPALRLLEAQGFHPFAKGLRLRSLLQFFGPYAPVVVLVPADEAHAAYTLLEDRWPVLDPPPRL